MGLSLANAVSIVNKMDINQKKQQFSFAYIRAVATVAGFSVSEPSVDDDSVDLMLASKSTNGAIKRPRLDIQVKCTGAGALIEEEFSFALKIKNYEDLRDQNVMVPRILVVVRVPDEPDTWVATADVELVMRHCGYWKSIRGQQAVNNTSSVTISIEKARQFNVTELSAMMQRIQNGGLP